MRPQRVVDVNRPTLFLKGGQNRLLIDGGRLELLDD
jgi:hypothetical protein